MSLTPNPAKAELQELLGDAYIPTTEDKDNWDAKSQNRTIVDDYDASTNTPNLTATLVAENDAVYVKVGGTITLNGVSTLVAAGDTIVKGKTKIIVDRLSDKGLQKANQVEARTVTLEDQTAKLEPKVIISPAIKPAEPTDYIRFTSTTATNQGQAKEILTWLTAKTPKHIAQVGVFIFKDSAGGSFVGTGRLQVLHKRGSAISVLLDKTITNQDLTPFVTPVSAISGGFANYEYKVDLTTAMTLQANDQVFVSLWLPSVFSPIYGNKNAMLSGGEWNNNGFCYRSWRTNENAAVTVYTDIPALPSGEQNYNAVHFYDKQSDLGRVQKIETDVTELKGKVVIPSEELVTGLQLFDKATKVVTGIGIGADGIVFPGAAYSSVRGVVVSPNTQYTPTGLQGTGGRGLRFEDSAGNLISYLAQMSNGVSFLTPANTATISFQLHGPEGTTLFANTLMIQKGVLTSAYEGYTAETFATRLNARRIKAAALEAGTKMGGKELALKEDVTSNTARIATNETAIAAMQTTVTGVQADTTVIKSRLKKVVETAMIRPSVTAAYSTFNSTEQAEIRSWLFGKSTKRINRVGVFVYKNTANGSFTGPLRVQIVHKRGTAVTILLNTTVAKESLAKFNTAGIIGSFSNYELRLNLTTAITLEKDDQLFVSQQFTDRVTPIFSSVTPLLVSGEWNNGTSCYRSWIANPGSATTVYTDVPALPGSPESNYNAVHFYEYQESDFDFNAFEERLKNLESGTNLGTEDFELLAPKDIYFANNAIVPAGSTATGYNARKDPLLIHLQRFLPERKEMFLEGGLNHVILSRNASNPVAKSAVQETVSIQLGGGKYLTKTVNINRVSVDTAVLETEFPKVLYIGDSITQNRQLNGQTVGAGALWLYAKEMALKNAAEKGSGYNYLCVGDQNGVNTSINYRNQTLTLRGYASGAGGWAASTWLRHPCRMWVNSIAGAWDLLGLKAQTQNDWSDTPANRLLITKTCFGKNTPVISGPAYNLLVAESQIANLGAWSNSTEQNEAVQAWITSALEGGGSNRYFDSGKNSQTNRFSIAKNLERYRTLANDGVTRLTVGTTAGTKVTNVNSYDVCEPTHVVICLGENDRLFHTNYFEIVNDIMELAQEIATQLPNAHIAICLTGIPGPMFAERHPLYKGNFDTAAHKAKFELYKELSSRFGSLSSQKASRIYLLPVWHTGTPLSHSNVSLQTYEGAPNTVIQVANDDFNHPGYGHNRDQQIYAWVAFTKVA